MNTSQFYNRIAERHDLSKAEAEIISKQFLETIQDIIVEDKSVTIPGLGTFDAHVREEVLSYNPHFKKKVIHPPKKVLDFRPASILKDIIENPDES